MVALPSRPDLRIGTWVRQLIASLVGAAALRGTTSPQSMAVVASTFAQAPGPLACMPEAGTDRVTLSGLGEPVPLSWPVAVWSGDELIVASLVDMRFHWTAFSPATGRWRSLLAAPRADAIPVVEPRVDGTLVWVAGRAVLWVGTTSPSAIGGVSLDPATDVARPITSAGAPAPRSWHRAVALGPRMLIWGGTADGRPICDGASYDPTNDAWAPIAPAPSQLCAQAPLAVVAAAGKMIVMGEAAPHAIVAAAYDPTTDRWAVADPGGAPRAIETAAVLPDGTLYVSDPTPSLAPVASGQTVDPGRHPLYVFDARTLHWSKRGSMCAGRLVALGEDLLQLGARNCLFEPGVGRCTELALFRFRAASHLVAAGDAVLLRLGSNILSGGPPFGSSPDTWALLRRGGPRPNALAKPRTGHTATLLPTNEILVAGGAGNMNAGMLAHRSAELYDPATGTWSEIDSMSAPRHGHTATLLGSGKVLVVGGVTAMGPFVPGLATAELYDPAAGTWSATGALAVGRVGHTATLLPSGAVLVVGGLDAGVASSVELYDAAQGRFLPAASFPNGPSRGHTATLLATGKVLICGGGWPCQLYDPTRHSSRPLGAVGMAPGRTATVLADGRVLFVGGQWVTVADLFDPATERWTATPPLATWRLEHTATRLLSGEVLVAGGWGPGGDLSSVEVFDPRSGTWRQGPAMHLPRRAHTATLLPSGSVLVVGGAYSEEYDSRTGRWIPLDSVIAQRTLSVQRRVQHHGNVRGIAGSIDAPWGGAARPTTIGPAAQTRLVVRKGERNSTARPVAAVTTNDLGLFELDLPAGSYCIVEAARASAPALGPPSQAECLRKVWSTCRGSFRVPESRAQVVVVHIMFEHGAPPCYVGPSPP